jgi:hypothetical protein
MYAGSRKRRATVPQQPGRARYGPRRTGKGFTYLDMDGAPGQRVQRQEIVGAGARNRIT